MALAGELKFSDAGSLWDRLRPHLQAARGERLEIDMSHVEAADGGSIALLVHLRDELSMRGATVEFAGANSRVATLIHLYKGDARPSRRKKRRPESMLAHVGRATLGFVDEVKLILSFLGTSVLALFGLLKEPKTGNWKEIWPTVERTGADALPIVFLINFLVGFVMAFQGANQLKQFGANIYVADLVGLSITRELGPLMTAIIVCGRTGAAYAAELGSMKVSEEIDALRTIGFGPIRYLVLPRTVALLIVMPILTLFADFVGVFGGVVVGIASLDLTLVGYLSETRKVMELWDVSSGLIKSVVFGLAIAVISCQQGFATSGGAQGVGKRTTSAVVTTLFALIVIDAAFTVFFHAMHL